MCRVGISQTSSILFDTIDTSTEMVPSLRAISSAQDPAFTSHPLWVEGGGWWVRYTCTRHKQDLLWLTETVSYTTRQLTCTLPYSTASGPFPPLHRSTTLSSFIPMVNVPLSSSSTSHHLLRPLSHTSIQFILHNFERLRLTPLSRKPAVEPAGPIPSLEYANNKGYTVVVRLQFLPWDRKLIAQKMGQIS